MQPIKLTAIQKAVLKLPELDRQLYAAIVADRISRIRALGIVPNVDAIEKEALEAIKLAGGVAGYIAEQCAEAKERKARKVPSRYGVYVTPADAWL